MAKRKLTKQQQARIRHTQSERLRRTERKSSQAEKQLEEGAVGPEQAGVVQAHYGATLAIECPADGLVYRCYQRANLPALVTGDRVTWCAGKEQTGVVVACEDRRSLLVRPDMRGQLRPVAANIDQIMIVFSSLPATPLALLDRYLVAAALSNIEPVLVLNKSDLLTRDDPYRTFLAEYEALGYRTLLLSAKEPLQETLVPELREKTTVFVGQSGVGKSSLIRQLLGDEQIVIGDISDATGKGKHTTTTAMLYHMPQGGDLIDSPGIREFGLWHVPADQVMQGFPDLFAYNGLCKFRDCKHQDDPGCAIQAAIEEGAVMGRRLDSYHSILASLAEVSGYRRYE